MCFPQPVPPFAPGPGDEGDGKDQQQDGVSPHSPATGPRGLQRRVHRRAGAGFSRRFGEAVLRHRHDEKHSEKTCEAPGHHEGQPQSDQRQPCGEADAGQSGKPLHLSPVLVGPGKPVRADLVGEPGVLRAAAEGPPKPPQGHGDQDRSR